MKCLPILTFLLLFLGCQDFQNAEVFARDEANTKTQIYGPFFKRSQETEKFKLLDLGGFDNFRDLVEIMRVNSCNGEISGLKLSSKDTVYHVLGNADCPDGMIACYFNDKQLFIENDSIVSFRTGNRPVEELPEIIRELTLKRGYIQNQNTKPFLIHLWINQDHPIAVTKKVLKTVVTSFDAVSSDSVSGFFKYHILFGSKSTPPPPPPFSTAN